MIYTTISSKKVLIIEDDDIVREAIKGGRIDMLIVPKEKYSLVWEALVPTLSDDAQVFIL